MGTSEIEREFDNRASTYDRSAMHRALASEVAAFIDLDDVNSVLDIATGTGLLLRSLPRPLQLAGVDISQEMVRVASSHLPSARVQRADGRQLPFAAASFDLVTCVSALPYLDVPVAIAEWRRVLKPAGRIVLTAWEHDGISSTRLLRRAAGEMGTSVADPNAPYGSVQALRELAATVGLSLTRVAEWSYPSAPIDAHAIVDRHSPLGVSFDLSQATPDERSKIAAVLSQLARSESNLVDRCLIAEFG